MRQLSLSLAGLLVATVVHAAETAVDDGEALVNEFVTDVVTFSGEFEQSLIDPDGRLLETTTGTLEIQRLIGRSLRAVTDFALLGEKTIWVDCDVLQADGGTRCASITGAYVALAIALDRIVARPLSMGVRRTLRAMADRRWHQYLEL